MGVTIFLAMLLHIGVAMWFSLPAAAQRPEPVKPLRVNLLAAIAETTTVASSPIVKPKPVKPKPVKPKPVKPKPVKPKPVKPKPVKPKPVKAKTEQRVAESDLEPELTTAEPIKAIVDAVATARYEQILVAWLEKYKQYPRRAKRLRIEGEGMLRIVIDRSGQTLKVSLAEPTGNRLLDKAALKMAQRANPFPAMPDNDPRRELEFIVPVAFVLR